MSSEEDAETIAGDKVVTIHYTLKNGAGQTLDSSEGNEPMAYLHGADNIVPGLERALLGKVVGDTLDVEIEPKDGYGERLEETVEMERSSFPSDIELKKGMQFAAETEHGVVPLWIDRVDGDTVYVDPNHPLAGEHLHFDVTIVDIRGATDHELEHGHPHGPGGHHH